MTVGPASAQNSPDQVLVPIQDFWTLWWRWWWRMLCDILVEFSGVKHDVAVNQAHWVFVKQTDGLWFWFMGQVVLMCSVQSNDLMAWWPDGWLIQQSQQPQTCRLRPAVMCSGSSSVWPSWQQTVFYKTWHQTVWVCRYLQDLLRPVLTWTQWADERSALSADVNVNICSGRKPPERRGSRGERPVCDQCYMTVPECTADMWPEYRLFPHGTEWKQASCDKRDSSSQTLISGRCSVPSPGGSERLTFTRRLLTNWSTWFGQSQNLYIQIIIL